MSRESEITKSNYRLHIRLVRFLNDTHIFQRLMRPDIDKMSVRYAKSSSKAKRPYPVPKHGRIGVMSKRTDKDIAKLLRDQHDRGIFENLITAIISRVEVYLVECLVLMIAAHPAKLRILGDDKSGIPLEVFLNGSDKEEILARTIQLRSEGLTYLPPAKYIEKLEAILSIKLDPEIVTDFIEAKASRDIVVHGSGVINATYTTKTGEKARGAVGAPLVIDQKYYKHVLVTAKRLTGNIMKEIEEKFG